jgi:hypothetical protein
MAQNIAEVMQAGKEGALAQHCNLHSTTTTTSVTRTGSSSTAAWPEGLRAILDRRVGTEDMERWQEIARNCTAALHSMGFSSVIDLASQNSTSRDEAFLGACGFRGVALEIELRLLAELRERILGGRCSANVRRTRLISQMEMALGLATLATAFLQALLLRDSWGEESDEDDDDLISSPCLGLEGNVSGYSCHPLMGTSGSPRQSRSRAPLVVSSVHQLAEQDMLPPTVGFEDDGDSLVSVSALPLITPKCCRLVDLVVAYAFLLYALEVFQTYGDAVSGMQFIVAACAYILPSWQYCETWSMTKYYSYHSLLDLVQIVLPLHLLARRPACPVALWACLATEVLSILDLVLLKGPRAAMKLQGKCRRGCSPEGSASQFAWAGSMNPVSAGRSPLE